jgi:hypothetical protein
VQTVSLSPHEMAGNVRGDTCVRISTGNASACAQSSRPPRSPGLHVALVSANDHQLGLHHRIEVDELEVHGFDKGRARS